MHQTSNELKLLVFSDTHLGFDYPLHPRIRIRRRGEDFFSNFQRILDLAVRKNVDCLVHTGDLFFRCKVPQDIVRKVYRRLLKTADAGIQLILLPGNHDCSRLPMASILSHPNIHVFLEPGVLKIPLGKKIINIAGFPFHRKNLHQSFQQSLDGFRTRMGTEDTNILLLHQTIQGAQVGPKNYTFGTGPDIIPKALLPSDYHLIICGHIHRSQTLQFGGPSNRNYSNSVIFPGSVERTSFAEKNEIKGFLKVKIDLRMREPDVNYRFVPLPARNMADVGIKSTDSIDSVLQDIRQKISTIDQDSIIRISFEKNFSRNILQQLNIGLIRSLVPETMSVEFNRSSFIR